MRNWYIMLRRRLATTIPVTSCRAAIARGRLMKLAITSQYLVTIYHVPYIFAVMLLYN